MLKLGDEQGGVRVKGTGSLPPPSSVGAGATPPQRHSESGGGGWTWVALAIVIIGVAALYVVWRVLHAHTSGDLAARWNPKRELEEVRTR